MQRILILSIDPEISWAKCVYWMYSILIEDGFGMNRDELMKKLEGSRIETRPFFYPIHVMPIHKISGKFPIAEKLSKSGINLPSGIKLQNEEIFKITKFIKSIIG